MVEEILQKLNTKQDLTANEAYHLMVSLIHDELNNVQIVGFEVALLLKGPTLTEITAIAQALRDNCIKIAPKINEELLDTCEQAVA